MIVSFILGWIAGVVGTLWFGRWLSNKQAEALLDEAIERRKHENEGDD